MGTSVAENKIDESINIMINVLNSSENNCISQTQQSARIISYAGGGATVNVNCTISQSSTIDTNCAQNTQTQTKLNTELFQSGQQQAEAISQFFSLSSAKSSNVYESYAELSQTISNVYTQTCIADSAQYAEVINIAEDEGTVINTTCDIYQVAKTTTSCIQNNSSVNDIRNKIVQQVEQEAKAKQQSFFAWLAIIAVAIVGFVALILFGLLRFGVIGGKAVTSGGSSTQAPPGAQNTMPLGLDPALLAELGELAL